MKEQKDAYNNIWKFYIAGPRAEEENPNSEIRIYEFDRLGHVTKHIDQLGNETTFEFDGLGRLVKTTAPEGNSKEYEFDAYHNVTTVTAKAKSGSGLSDIVNEFTYDATWKNKVKTAENGLGNVVTYTYNSTTGTLTRVEFPVINSQTPTIEFTYNGRGQVLTKEDPTGIITEFTYDSTTEKLTQVVVDEGTGRKNITSAFTYDSVGNVTAVQNPNGDSTSFEYDDLRRLTKVTAPSPFNYQTKFTYDENGNRTKVEKETGDVSNPWQTSTAAYDIDGLLESITDPGSQTTSFDYNSLRQLWKTTDAASRVTTRAYDELGRITTVTDNASVVQVTNTYTTNGLLDTVEDGEGNETEYQYDGFDRLKKKIYPNAKYEELTYDANSRVTMVRNRNADEVDFTYDVLGRLTQKAPDGMPTVSYEYDLAGRRTKVSTSVVSGNPASGDFDYYYDTAGRLTKEEWPDNKSVQYEYDDNGNVTKVTYPDSYYVERVFDEINRLTGIKLNGATALALEFEHDKLSRRTKLTYENGVETDYGFQLDNDMESLIQTFTGSSVEFSYGFNSVHELTSQSVDDSAYMWHPASAGTVTYAAANNMNQYPTVGGNSFSYDDNGCLTDDGTFAFTYDTENQLIEADDGSTVSSYIYDPMRRQNQKDVGGTKTRYIYDGLQMISEYDGSGTLQKKYVYGAGLDEVLIELDSSNNPTYLHHDRKGSIIATSNSSGAVISSYAYSPFGEGGSMSGTTFGYTGQRFDPETGLYYYKNRHYSPELGRFLQPDLIGYGDGLNVYQYGYNDPNMFSDPLGLAKRLITMDPNDLEFLLGIAKAMKKATKMNVSATKEREWNAAVTGFGEFGFGITLLDGAYGNPVFGEPIWDLKRGQAGVDFHDMLDKDVHTDIFIGSTDKKQHTHGDSGADPQDISLARKFNVRMWRTHENGDVWLYDPHFDREVKFTTKDIDKILHRKFKFEGSRFEKILDLSQGHMHIGEAYLYGNGLDRTGGSLSSYIGGAEGTSSGK